ncbi:hypothetical protein ABBQ32_005348 [Trebouxia sp. C0010 RCD-2024]
MAATVAAFLCAAFAAPVPWLSYAPQLLLPRQQDLKWSRETSTRASVIVLFLLQLCLKALPLMTSTYEAQQNPPQEKQSTESKASINRKKQQPRIYELLWIQHLLMRDCGMKSNPVLLMHGLSSLSIVGFVS